MKKPKVSLDSAKLQTFFIHHVEKILLVVVLLMMALLVYQGFGLASLEGNKTPDSLLQKSTQTIAFIDDPNRWEAVKEERVVVMDVGTKVHEGQLATDSTQYFLPTPWSKPNFPKLAPRTDPELFPPTDLVVIPVFGPLAAIAKPGELDQLYQLSTEEVEAKKPKAKTRRNNRRQRGGSSEMYGADMYGSEGVDMYSGDPGYGQQSSRRSKGRTKGRSASGSSGSGYSEMPMDPMGSGYSDESGYGSSGYGSSGYGSSGYGTMPGGLYPEATEFGFQSNNPMTIARDVRANVILAVVPYEKQLQAFENALANSLDYNPARDMPSYLHYQVQRVDVTADPDAEVAEEDWRWLNVNAALIEALGSPPTQPGQRGTPPVWAGVPQEIIDPRYWDQKLTHPAPPFMQRDLWDLLTHPLVPIAARTAPGMGQTGMPGAADATGAAEETGTAPAVGPTDAAPDVPSVLRPGAMPGSMGMPGASGYGSSGYGSSGYGSSGYGGSSMPGYGSSGYGDEVGSSGYGSSGYGSSGYGDEMGSSGYGSGYGSGGYGQPVIAPPKYKLVRFTDTAVEHGKVYRYRVRVLLNDPNHPYVPEAAAQTQGGIVAPNPASLADDVQTRIKALDDATFWRESPWSEASQPAELPSPNRFYVGTVSPTPSAPIRMPNGNVEVPSGQPEATALAVVWDATKVADIPAETKVFRGSVLNFEAETAKVIHPVTKEVIELPKYAIATDAVVADIRGGETLPRIDKATDTRLSVPGEFLIFDAHGRLRVQNEVEDIEMFRRFTVPKEDTTRPQGVDPYDPYAAEGSGMPGSSSDPNYANQGSSGYGMPGDSGGRGKRRGSR